MKPRTISLVIMITILALIWSSSAWADRFNVKNHRQTQRIRQGIHSGKITRPEAQRLKNEQRHIHSAYRRAFADGHLNRREHQRLSKLQNRASRHIYQAKHNRAYRKAHHRHAVVHKHNINCYYPVEDSGYADGYAFSVGLSDIGWQFAFSGWSR